MTLYLHNPASQAHLDELKDRLTGQPTSMSSSDAPDRREDMEVEMLLEVVRSMDKGVVTPREAIDTFTRHGFVSFTRWLVDMLDEGVYLDTRLSKAA